MMPNYSFREGEEEAAYHLWPSDHEEILLHPHCTRTPSDREFPLYVDDLIEGNSFQEPLICDRCNGEILIGRIATL